MFMTKTKTHNENKVDLKKKTYAELQELLERQDNILSNKPLVEVLADKGEKIKKFRVQLDEELKKRDVHEALCKDMSLLNIHKDQINTLEWTGLIPNKTVKKDSRSNIDDDDDVLKMFVSHSGLYADKIIIEEKPEEPLIKPSDLIDEVPIVKDEQQSYESKEFPVNVERYAKNLCGRIDTHLSTNKHQLLLNKPAIPNKESAVKAAVVSLKESVTLQYLHENKLKAMNSEKPIKRPNIHFDPSCYRESNVFHFDEFAEDSDEENYFFAGPDDY